MHICNGYTRYGYSCCTQQYFIFIGYGRRLSWRTALSNFKKKLMQFSKLISENEFSSAENIDTGKDSDVKMENDDEVFTPYSLFPAEDLEDFLSDDPEEEDDLYWDKEEADGLNWNWDEEEDDDIDNDCEGDFDDDFCTF